MTYEYINRLMCSIYFTELPCDTMIMTNAMEVQFTEDSAGNITSIDPQGGPFICLGNPFKIKAGKNILVRSFSRLNQGIMMHVTYVKTTYQWLQTIPNEIIRATAIANMWWEDSESVQPDLLTAIRQAFNWSLSPEGFAFWKEVEDSLKQ
jgi:hypothetical protein